MAITHTVTIGGTKFVACSDCKDTIKAPCAGDKPLPEIYCLAKDMAALRALEGVENATLAYIMDFKALTDAEKTANDCASAVYMYDADGKRWLPQ